MYVKNFRQRVIVPAECVTVHAQCTDVAFFVTGKKYRVVLFV